MGNPLGIHGRIANLPAYNLSWGAGWENDEYTIWVEGTLHETAVFGENLTLKRRIWTRLNEPRLWIEDQVENHGFNPRRTCSCSTSTWAFRWSARLPAWSFPSMSPCRVTSRRAWVWNAAASSTTRSTVTRSRSFITSCKPDNQGQVELRLVNPAFNGQAGLGVSLRFAQAEYPVFVEWKMMGEGIYVIGLEPANCHVEGRTKERQRGTLVMLQPGEVRTYRLEIGFQ